MPISADLGDQLEDVVEGLVRNGRYNSKSEVLREGVRLVQEREARLALDAAIARGIAGNDVGTIRPAEEVFVRLEAQYRAKVREFDEMREQWLRTQIATREAEMRSDSSLGIPIEEAFKQVLKTKRQRS